MTTAQLSFDFTEPVAQPPRAGRHDFAAEDRAHWRVGMVTSLPCFCTIEGSDLRYTQMLPGVVEEIAGDLASIRIYAAPEYGYTINNYPLHMALAINVPLHELGKFHWHKELQRIVNECRLATGDAELGAEVRARASLPHTREIASAL